NSGGNITPQILLNSFCWLRKRPSISATRPSGNPRASRACWRASAACCAWRRSRARRSCAVRRRRALAFASCLACRVVGDMRNSFALCGSGVDGLEENAPHTGESRASSSSRAPYFLLSFPGHLRYIYGLAARILTPSSTSLVVHGGWAMNFEETLDQAIA